MATNNSTMPYRGLRTTRGELIYHQLPLESYRTNRSSSVMLVAFSISSYSTSRSIFETHLHYAYKVSVPIVEELSETVVIDLPSTTSRKSPAAARKKILRI